MAVGQEVSLHQAVPSRYWHNDQKSESHEAKKDPELDLRCSVARDSARCPLMEPDRSEACW